MLSDTLQARKSKQLTLGLVNLVAVESLSLSVIRAQESRELYRNFVDFDYTPPCAHQVRTSILPSLSRMYFKSNIEHMNSQRDHTITVEFDAWTSGARLKILAVLSTYPSSRSELLDLIVASASLECIFAMY